MLSVTQTLYTIQAREKGFDYSSSVHLVFIYLRSTRSQPDEHIRLQRIEKQGRLLERYKKILPQ